VTPWRAPSRKQCLAWLAGLALVGAGVGAWRLLRQDSRVSVAISSWPGYEAFYLAEQRRLGQRFGIDLRVQQYSSLDDQRAAYGRGDVEIIATTIPDAIAICQETPSRCPQLILVLDHSAGADVLVSRREITSVRGLVGQRVGLERAVLSEYLLLRALEAERLGLDQVRLVHEGPQGLVAAFQRGDLAAVVTYPPHANPLRSDPRYRVLFSSLQIPGEVLDVLAVNPAFAQRHADQLRDLVRTWWASRALIQAEPVASQALMAQREQVSLAAFVESERWIRYPGPGEQHAMLGPKGAVDQVVSRMAAEMVAARRILPEEPLPTPSRAFLAQP
jgi:NitT/TauT family transport system substrate-binding protein